uniref:rhomboid protease n=1 Tax=Oryzias melastigma TaxID=30732 RepID=A0A3B3DP11_ORYME
MAWRGCLVKWSRIESIKSQNTITSSSRFNPYHQQRFGFRREAKRSDTKRGNETQEPKASPPEPGTPVSQPPPKIRRPSLLRPLMFTVGFTGCSFGAAAILQYETLKSRVQAAKDGEELEKLGSQDMAYWHDWWNQLSGIIAINTAVLCCWRIPSLQRSMIKYFTSNPASSVISTMVSYVCKTATGRFHPSLGASGAVMAVLAAVCAKVPEAKLGIIFLPMFTFSAGNVTHLGGALFGVWYVAYGHKLIWRKREPLVKLWHDIRSPGSKGSKPGSGGGSGHP